VTAIVKWQGWRWFSALCWLVGVAACGDKHTVAGMGADAADAPGDDATSSGGGAYSSSGAGGHGGRPAQEPPAQGAMRVRLSSPTAPVLGKMCPSGAAQIFDVPAVANEMPKDELSEDTYLHKVVDGEAGALVSCRVVKTTMGFDFEGAIQLGSKSLTVKEGTLADRKGTAHVDIQNSESLPITLSSPVANCTIDVSRQSLQVAAGAMWATFTCASVEHAPSDFCAADGVFVFENCAVE
jgi:hypothetical protein